MARTTAVKNNLRQHPVRFYEGLCLPFDGEPTSEDIAIIQSKEMGQGVVSRRTFNKGDIVFKFFGPALKEQTLYTLQQAPGVYIEDPIVMGRVLHSCEPNMICDVANLTFIAAREIAFGEYLTMDYDSTEDTLFRAFECCCGAKNCRGTIRGRLFR